MNNQTATGFLFWTSLLLIFLVACNPKNESIPPNAFPQTKTIKPPVIIKAGHPIVISLSDKPLPETVELSIMPAPVKRPAGFFITMQNLNTDQGLALSSILCSYKDHDGNLWFGTFGNGVSRYDGRTFTNFSSAHGLAHNLINSIAEDSKGNIWFNTFGGVSIYDGVSFKNFTTAHGLPDNDVLQSLEDSRGNIWLTTEKGVCRYLPHES
jgi:ligand-binding sensor domain-containing protein